MGVEHSFQFKDFLCVLSASVVKWLSVQQSFCRFNDLIFINIPDWIILSIQLIGVDTGSWFNYFIDARLIGHPDGCGAENSNWWSI